MAHVLSETVTAADDDNDTIARMRNNVSPMVGGRGVGEELTDERDRWPPSVSRIVTVVVVVVIVIICLLSIVAVDCLLVVLAANIMLCIYRCHCSRHRRHHATETWRLGLAVTSKSFCLHSLYTQRAEDDQTDSQQKHVTEIHQHDVILC